MEIKFHTDDTSVSNCPMSWVCFLCIFGNGYLYIQSDISWVFQEARFTEDEGGRCLCRSVYIGKPLRQPSIPCFQLKWMKVKVNSFEKSESV